MQSWAGAASRIIVVWFALLSLENAVSAIQRPANGHGWGDWLKGQLIGVPFALALLVPAAVILVVLVRQVAARRAYLVAAVMAAAAAGIAYALSSGPTVSALERRIPFVLAVACVAFGITFVFVRKVPLDRPRVLALLGVCAAVVALVADQRVLPGLYSALHASFIAVALAGTACIALVVPAELRLPPWPRVWRAVGTLAVGWAITSAVLLGRDELLRHILLRDAPVLGRVVFLSSQLPSFGTDWDIEAEADDTGPDIASFTHSSEERHALDWSGCDMLLVSVDSLRPDHLGAYGYARPTSPEIDKLAARGARFEWAYSAAPFTSYSTTALMVGRNMRSLLASGGAHTATTRPEHMRALGYDTVAWYPPALFSSIDSHHLEALRAKGFGFEHYVERNLKADELYAELSSYVARAPREKPMFAWVHVFEPHHPYQMHAGRFFAGGRDIDAYDSEIAETDAFIGKAAALVEDRGRCTVIMVTSDHGEAFGEHGTKFHGSTVYEEQLRVPLVIVAPGVAPGTVFSRPVQTIDLVPTALSALGQARPSIVMGRDLGPVLAGKASADDLGFAFAETRRYTMLAVGMERLICDRTARTCMLYDLAKDASQSTVVRDRPERVRFLRQLTHSIAEASAARFPLRLPVTSLLRPAKAALESGTLVATGEPGTIVFGPYIVLPPGTYELSWRGTGIDSPGHLAFSVRADHGAEILADVVVQAKDLPREANTLVRLPFVLDRERSAIEFLVESADGARVILEHVTIETAKPSSR